MAHDCFISYSSPDKNTALAVLHGLERAGIRCWLAPRDIKPGAIWAQAIMEGIAGARVLVVVFSANANRSANVINEVDAAVRKGAIIVPFRIEDVMPEGAMEYHLRTRHWLDALTPDLEAHTKRLAEQVKSLLETAPAVRPEPPSAHREKPADLPPRPARPPQPPRGPRGPRNWKRIAALAGIGAVAVLGAGYALTRKRRVADVEFTVRQVSSAGGNELTMRMRSTGLRFFEAGPTMPAVSQRQYATTFAAGASRYLHVEVNLAYEAPGREITAPMACDLFSRGDQVYATLSINARIQPAWTQSAHAVGWGTARGGSWTTGRYRVECKYGGKLIGRDWFDVVAGGAPSSGSPPPAPAPRPPPPPPPPAARLLPERTRLLPESPVITAGPLGDLGARVRSLRFYESGYGAIPPGERRYRSRFPAAEARFVNLELTLEHPAPGRPRSGGVTCRYLNEENRGIGRVRITVRIEPSWTVTVSTSGWGGRSPGTWTPGSYLVECDDGRATVAQGRFQVY